MLRQSEIELRKVRLLGDRARKQAIEQGFSDDDLVLIRTTVDSLPTYEITKVEGSPSSFIQDYFFGQAK